MVMEHMNRGTVQHLAEQKLIDLEGRIPNCCLCFKMSNLGKQFCWLLATFSNILFLPIGNLAAPSNSVKLLLATYFLAAFRVAVKQKPGTNPRTKHGDRHPRDVKMLSTYLAGLAAIVRQVASALAFMHKSPWAQDFFFKQEFSDFWLDVAATIM